MLTLKLPRKQRLPKSLRIAVIAAHVPSEGAIIKLDFTNVRQRRRCTHALTKGNITRRSADPLPSRNRFRRGGDHGDWICLGRLGHRGFS